jgi:hypothetical protein
LSLPAELLQILAMFMSQILTPPEASSRQFAGLRSGRKEGGVGGDRFET